MSATRLVLIRHGESVAQERQLVGGHEGCTGLSDLGRRQSAALRDRLEESGELMEAVALYTSVMDRAIETAGIIASGVAGHDIVRNCDFCEHHPGDADGLTWTEANSLYPEPEPWSPDVRRAPGSETWTEMRERVARGIDEVIARHAGEIVVIVCHGGVIAHSMIRWLGLEPRAVPGRRARLEPANTSITEWLVSNDRPGDGPDAIQLLRFNDHSHLSQLVTI